MGIREERAAKVKDFVKRYKWKGPVYEISALTREGCEPLIKEIFQFVHSMQKAEQEPQEVDPRFVAGAELEQPDYLDDPRFSSPD